MRKSIFVLHRDGVPVAELHLEMCGSKGVESWEWRGDAGVAKAFGLPPVKRRDMWYHWRNLIDDNVERLGFTYTKRAEGDPHIREGSGMAALAEAAIDRLVEFSLGLLSEMQAGSLTGEQVVKAVTAEIGLDDENTRNFLRAKCQKELDEIKRTTGWTID